MLIAKIPLRTIGIDSERQATDDRFSLAEKFCRGKATPGRKAKAENA
jgi:hypothetical protein